MASGRRRTGLIRAPSSLALRSGVLLCAGVFACWSLLSHSLDNAFAAVAAPKPVVERRNSPPRAFGASIATSPTPATQRVVAREAADFELGFTGTRTLIQHVNRWPGRMTERWLGPVNWDRASLRIDTMDTYSVLASLLLGCFLGFYGCVEQPADDAPKGVKLVFEAQMWLLMFATLLSSFTTILFLLNKVYSCSALGLWKDVAFFNFQYHTATQRKLAFWSLLFSLLAFVVSFALNAYEKLGHGKKAKVAMVGTIVVGGAMSLSIGELMGLATKLIFTTYPY